MKTYHVIRFDELDSTNNYARGLIGNKASEEGTVVLAQYQKQGRGHGRNGWESEAGKNLLCSLILKPEFLPPSSQFLLSMVVSLGVSDFVASETENVSIKWPNDIYVSNKKVAGILIENTITGNQISGSIAGIGLNVNQKDFRGNAPNPVSMIQLTGKEYQTEDVLESVIGRIGYWYRILKGGNTVLITDMYLNRMYMMNKPGRFRTENLIFDGRISGVDEFGRLKIETAEGLNLFGFKEVEYLITGKEVL